MLNPDGCVPVPANFSDQQMGGRSMLSARSVLRVRSRQLNGNLLTVAKSLFAATRFVAVCSTDVKWS